MQSTIRTPAPLRLGLARPPQRSSRPQLQGYRRLQLRAELNEQNGAGQKEGGLRYDHILLAILDSNPHLSSASRSALATAAGLVANNNSRLTIVFVDEQGKKLNGQRFSRVQGELRAFGIDTFECVEEEIEPSVGKGSVAVGDVADQVEADLVVMSSEAVHAKHVDANLLAEFVPCPVLLLP